MLSSIFRFSIYTYSGLFYKRSCHLIITGYLKISQIFVFASSSADSNWYSHMYLLAPAFAFIFASAELQALIFEYGSASADMWLLTPDPPLVHHPGACSIFFRYHISTTCYFITTGSWWILISSDLFCKGIGSRQLKIVWLITINIMKTTHASSHQKIN